MLAPYLVRCLRVLWFVVKHTCANMIIYEYKQLTQFKSWSSLPTLLSSLPTLLSSLPTLLSFSPPHTHQSSKAMETSTTGTDVSDPPGVEPPVLLYVIVPDISTSLHILRGIKTNMKGVRWYS